MTKLRNTSTKNTHNYAEVEKRLKQNEKKLELLKASGFKAESLEATIRAQKNIVS